MSKGISVLACFTDPRMGGPGTRAISVAERISDHDIEVDFLIPSGKGEFADAAREIGATVHRMDIPRIRSPRLLRENIRFLTTFRKKTKDIGRLIEKEGYDIVHVNTPYNFQPAIATAKSDAALVWHFNDVLTPRPINKIAGSLANRYADGVAISCESAIDYFGLSSEPLVTLYPPVDLERFNPDDHRDRGESIRSELGIDPSTFLIGTVGNINPIKGYDVLIDAFDGVQDQFSDTKLIAAGSELDSQQRYNDRIHSRIREHELESEVEFLGWRSDIPEILSELDLFVIASRSETGPLVAFEAMAMECPLVSTKVGALAEQAVNGRHAWLVEPEDADALRRALVDAIDSQESRNQRTAHARRLVEETFSLDAAVENHCRLYRDTLQDSPAGI